MDKVKSKSPKSQKKLTIIGTASLILLLGYYLVTANNQVTLSKSNLLIATVKQGDLPITVAGYGKLISEQVKLITATTDATVSEILLKPGAAVTENSVIAKLENPQLIRQLQSEQQELAQRQANLRQLKIDQQREQLTEQARLTEIEASYQSAQLKRQAQQQLVDKGIISQISFKQSQLDENQFKTRLQILTKRLEKLTLVHQEALNIQQQRIVQQQGKLDNIQQQLDQLTIKANFDGVIQRLPITLGENLQAGQEIALIGSTQQLVAEVFIPQNQAQLVRINQPVAIDTRQQVIHGEVSRIDPIVENNSVKIDVKPTESFPVDARPEQSIDASIQVNLLKNIRYIEKPINAKAHSQHTIYQLNNAQDIATPVIVSFGETSGRYIEITSVGNSAKHNSTEYRGERFILSDLSNYQNTRIHLH